MNCKNLSIEELELPVRAYNTLKRTGINTLEDLFHRLDMGADTDLPFHRMSCRQMEEILMVAQEHGYPAHRFALQYLPRLRQDPQISEQKIRFWQDLENRLRRVIPDTPEAEATHPGVQLRSIDRFLGNQFARIGIATVEELLDQYRTYEDLPLSTYRRWELIIALERNGFRLADAPRDRWPNVKDYILHNEPDHINNPWFQLPLDYTREEFNAIYSDDAPLVPDDE